MLTNGGNNWTLPAVDLNTPGTYRVRIIAFDNAGNRSNWTDNPVSDFTVISNDSVAPTAQVTNPLDGANIAANVRAVAGSASDNSSGVSRVQARIETLDASPKMFWNGSAWTTSSSYPDAVLLNNGDNWRLPAVDLTNPGRYRVRIIAFDNAGNRSGWSVNPVSNFTVN